MKNIIETIRLWFAKVKFIWNINLRYYELREEITRLEKVLMEKRLANFVHIQEYKADNPLSWMLKPTISLEDLDRRLENVEAELFNRAAAEIPKKESQTC